MDENINKKIIDADFSRMLSLAENYFDTNNLESFEYHQCLVLKTEQGEKLYSFNCSSVKDLIEQSCEAIINEKINVVTKIVCMWSGKHIDVPSYKFMKTLCALNDKNKETQILLRGAENTYSIKKISSIINT